MNNRMIEMLRFLLRHPNNWHSVASSMHANMEALARENLIEVIRYENALPQVRVAMNRGN